jgi:hypothetical protein
MKLRGFRVALLGGAIGCCSLPALGQTVGPDVIVGSLDGIAKFGTEGGITSYSIGTTSCNIGDMPVEWNAGTSRHPVIGQNLYRLKNGRFEQIGMSWLKHGFYALSLSLCQTCTQQTDGSILGVGCSDPYDTSLNGEQANLGPRSQVDAYKGAFPFPYTAPPFSGVIMRRLQVLNSDLDPAQNAGALYFGEGHYVTADDAEWLNHFNNASYRRCQVGSFTGGGYNMSMTGSTFRQEPAINAWAANDTGVTLLPFNLQNEGRLILGYKVSVVTAGTWHYEYALYNMNSTRSIRSFSVPIPAGVQVTNIGFHDCDHHSGEPYTTTDWTGTLANGALTWDTQTYAQNTNAHALRWGTLFNFRFDANVGPATGPLTLGVFRPAVQTSLTVQVSIPQAPADPCAAIAPADANCDGTVDFFDIDPFLTALFDHNAYIANAEWCGNDCAADVNGDHVVDFFDIDPFLNCVFSGCP